MNRRTLHQLEQEIDRKIARLNLPEPPKPSRESVDAACARAATEARRFQVRFGRRLAILRYGAVAAGVALAYVGTRSHLLTGSSVPNAFDEPLAIWAQAFEESSDQLAAQVSGYPDDGLFDSEDAVSIEELMSDSGA